MIQVELVGLRVEMPTNTPVVILREKIDGGRVLPIFIGGPEATAIAFALEGVETTRPMTHDLWIDTIGGLDITLDRVEITEIRDRIFYAELVLLHNGVEGSQEVRVSSRPSDALALALRAHASIFVAESVIEQAGQPPESADVASSAGEAGESEELVEEFRQFLNDIDPTDFQS